MKKLALILAFLVIPCAAFGLEMLTDSSMDTITGQDGVSIVADDIQIFLNVDLFAYIDADGYDLHNGCAAEGCSNGAMFGVTDFQIDVLNINAIIGTSRTTAINTAFSTSYQNTTGGMKFPLVSSTCGIPLFYNYMDSTKWGSCLSSCLFTNTASPLYGKASQGHKGLDNYTDSRMWENALITNAVGNKAGAYTPNALNIDLTDKLPTFSEAFSYLLTGTIPNGVYEAPIEVMGVLITLPTLEIHIQEIHFTAALYDLDTTCATDTTGQILPVNGGYSAIGGLWAQGEYPNRFGEFMMSGVTMSILSGWVEIAPH